MQLIRTGPLCALFLAATVAAAPVPNPGGSSYFGQNPKTAVQSYLNGGSALYHNNAATYHKDRGDYHKRMHMDSQMRARLAWTTKDAQQYKSKADFHEKRRQHHRDRQQKHGSRAGAR